MSAPSSYRMPAEWEPHAATWLIWPHNHDDWPGKLEAVHWAYGEIVRGLLASEPVNLVVAPGDEGHAREVLDQVGVDWKRLRLIACASDRSWTRDTGPIFLQRRAGADLVSSADSAQPVELVIGHFRFNAWARYDNYHRDARIPEVAAATLGLPLVDPRRIAAGDEPAGDEDGAAAGPVVLEGGAIDVNGAGAILTTEECLLDPVVQVRNPGYGRQDYEQLFARYLGAQQTIWLGKGIAGDDTHGHVDDLCRFVDARTVVLCQTEDAGHPSYRALQENRERLQGVTLAEGHALGVVALPLPGPLSFAGHLLPASYANFYIANERVLVPTFNDPQDRVALGVLAELFPQRVVQGIHAVDLVWGFGTLHCLTQQQPRA